ncbi:MAG: hypothetical protein ACRDLP_09760, partial [Solirubrobacteraceae bacterium]
AAGVELREGSVGVEQREGGGVTATIDDGSVVALDPLGTPSMLADGTRIWLCGAHGTLEGAPLDGVGTVTHGVPHRDAPLERSVTLVLDAELAVAIGARRPAGACGHGDELIDAVIFRGELSEGSPVAVPHISTTYDAAGRVAHVGVELWESDESEFAMRLGGEAHAHGELRDEEGALVAVSFLDAHGEGRRGAGCYLLSSVS